MANENKSQDQNTPKPDPALKRLDRLVGKWIMMGHPLGSKEDSIGGTTTFRCCMAPKAPAFSNNRIWRWTMPGS